MKRFLLWGLTALFTFRVVAQLVQWLAPVAFLPAFAEFHGAVLPYPVLLGSQVVILSMMFTANRRVDRDWHPSLRLARGLRVVGAVYFVAMLFRLSAGLSGWIDHAWFHKPIPSFFHLVLAAYLLTLGVTDANRMKRFLRLTAYPLTFVAAFSLYALPGGDVPLVARTYAAVLLGVGIIVLMEQFIPYSREWRPEWREFADDAVYALTVQVLLPRLLAIAAALALAAQIEYAASVWPHQWPSPIQAVLMMALADLLRYWLHRASHEWPLLWRLHEVHHSAKRLYWLNTSRFHPIEKALQFLFDTLPFILLGVSEQVIALYFVFYAINGFYQHSNADVRLGPLNYLVSGPQLHRWHHSKTIRESNANYGNNLILWDILFRTRFLPRDREVGELGIHASRYPERFLGQLLAPFRRN